jgi:Holliday junction resolvasome RuvABC endonuclease subunit
MEAQSLGSIGDIDQLGQINGVVQVLLQDLGMSPLRVAPALVKKFVTGHGQATKQEMMRATWNEWGVPFTQDDLCDAHGLARIAQAYTELNMTARHQLEVIHTLSQPKKRKKRTPRLFPKTI